MTTGGSARFTAAGFHSFSLPGQDVDSFVGSSADDVLGVGGHVENASMSDGDDELGATSIGQADLGPGDDAVDLDDSPLGHAAIDRELSAGPGRDRLSVTTRRVQFDAGSQTLDLDGDGPVPAAGIDASTLYGREVDVQGSSASDDVVAGACRLSVATGPGDDDVVFTDQSPDNDFSPRCRRGQARIDLGAGDDHAVGYRRGATVHGGAGDDLIRGESLRDVLYGDGGADVLRGGRGDDRLVGGQGEDSGHGGPGGDTCRLVEHRTSCPRG